MAKRCVFCGKNLSFFDDKTLLCGNALQSVCSACWAGMQDMDQEERARRALDTGRAEEPEVIQAYLDRLEQMRQAQARAREALATIGVALADHIIVADGDFVSMADSGYLT